MHIPARAAIFAAIPYVMTPPDWIGLIPNDIDDVTVAAVRVVPHDGLIVHCVLVPRLVVAVAVPLVVPV